MHTYVLVMFPYDPKRVIVCVLIDQYSMFTLFGLCHIKLWVFSLTTQPFVFTTINGGFCLHNFLCICQDFVFTLSPSCINLLSIYSDMWVFYQVHLPDKVSPGVFWLSLVWTGCPHAWCAFTFLSFSFPIIQGIGFTFLLSRISRFLYLIHSSHVAESILYGFLRKDALVVTFFWTLYML